MLRSPDYKCRSNPDIATGSVPVENVTQRKRKQPESEFEDAINKLSHELNKKLDDWRGDLDCYIAKISENVNGMKVELASLTQVSLEIKNEIVSLRSDHGNLEKQVCSLESKHLTVTEDVASLQNSLQYTMDQQEDLKFQIKSVRDQTKSTESLKNLVAGLEVKIDSLEQQARQCNLELCNIPEKRNENLLTLMEDISSKIHFSLNQKDILTIHRVSHAHKESKTAKNIIIKLSSRIIRDNMLSTFRLAKGLSTEQLGFTGTSNRIYMHEHLTLKKKELFRQCKEAAVKNSFKFVWVKHATILVREIESEPAIAIRSTEDVAKIKSTSKPKKH